MFSHLITLHITRHSVLFLIATLLLFQQSNALHQQNGTNSAVPGRFFNTYPPSSSLSHKYMSTRAPGISSASSKIRHEGQVMAGHGDQGFHLTHNAESNLSAKTSTSGGHSSYKKKLRQKLHFGAGHSRLSQMQSHRHRSSTDVHKLNVRQRSRNQSDGGESVIENDGYTSEVEIKSRSDPTVESKTKVESEDLVRQPRSRIIRPTPMNLRLPVSVGVKSDGQSETTDPNDEFKNSPIVPAIAVSGNTAVLPCNISSPEEGDSIQLVLWYKDSVPTPIYSYDVRLGLYSRPKEWSDPTLLGRRAHFSVATQPAALVVNASKKADEGVYRCRVDFKRHITTHARVNLTVIEPVSRISIEDFNGNELVTVAGPFSVNSTPSLVCRAIGGNPTPVITWWKNRKPLISTYGRQDIVTSNLSNRRPPVLLSTLTLEPLKISDLRSTFSCRASNHEMAPEPEAAVEIDMNFGPDNVTVRGLGGPLSTNRRHQVMCEARGSRPPAILTWYLDGNIVKSISHITSQDGQGSSSTLELMLRPADDGAILTCRAENSELPASVLEHSQTLQVLYPPIVKIAAGTSLDLDAIKEGDDVYFDCLVDASPKDVTINWMLNGFPLTQNVSHGVMAVGESLVLQRVSRKQAGNYSCKATNSQGFNSSQPIFLSIKYSPVCRIEQDDGYGVGRLEKTTVTCRVDADPPATTYRWAFNNTGEFVDINQSHYTVSADRKIGQKSDLRYSPMSDLDYGTLLCWAKNSVGNQKIPCTFTVFPAGKPEAVASCRAANQTEESIAVVCEAGYSGGVNQSFHLEAWDDGALRASERSDNPLIEVSGLRPGTRYTLRVFAENSMGRSQPYAFTAFTLTDVAERRTAIGKGEEGKTFNPVVGSIVGASASILLLIVVGILLARCKRHDGRNGQNKGREPKPPSELDYKSCSEGGDAPVTGRSLHSGARSPPTGENLNQTNLDDKHNQQRIGMNCDLVTASQDSILMSRSQDSNAPLLGSGRPPNSASDVNHPFDTLKKSDLSYSQRENMTKQQKIPLIGTGGSPNSGSSPATTPVTSSIGSHISSPVQMSNYHFAEDVPYTHKHPVENKWPPEDWYTDQPFLFSPSSDIDPGRSYLSESNRIKASPHSSLSPTSSVAVDPRRHSAYLRPLDELQEEQKYLTQTLHKAKQHHPSDYSQHSLPRQYFKNTKPHQYLPSDPIGSGGGVGGGGGSNTTTSPLGFSSNPYQQRQYGAGMATIGTQRVTKPSSPSTKLCSSDHESSV